MAIIAYRDYVIQESCAIAKMTARCADKSKQTATWYDPAIKVRSSDVNKGAWQIPCRNCGLRPGLKVFAPKFLQILEVGGWPLGYEEQRCWANCLRC